MTVPNYLMGTGIRLFSDERLKGYLYYKKLLADQIRGQVRGVQMVVNIASEFSQGVVSSMLLAPQLLFEVTHSELPSSTTPYLSRANADLTLFREVRLTLHCIDDDGSEGVMWLQYSPDNGSNWYDIGETSQTEISFVGVGTDVNLKSAWVDIASGAQADILFRLWGYDSTQFPPGKYPVVDNVNVECRTIYENQYPTWTYDEYIELAALNEWPPYGTVDPIIT